MDWAPITHKNSRLFGNPGSKKKREERTEITQDYVLKGYKKIAERSLQDGTWDSRGACEALKMLGNHLGMWKDRQEITGKNGEPLEVMHNARECLLNRINQVISAGDNTPGDK